MISQDNKRFGRGRRLILACAAVAVAAATAVWLAVAVTTDLRKPDGCMAVDDALVATIMERSPGASIDALAATAVENPFVRARSSVPYDTYYLIGIRFRTPDGTTLSGVWGLGTNTADHGQERRVGISGPIDGRSSSLAAVTSDARTWTDWQNHDMPVQHSDPLVGRTLQCLSRAGSGAREGK